MTIFFYKHLSEVFEIHQSSEICWSDIRQKKNRVMCWIYCPDQGIDTMLVCTELSPQNVTKVAWTGTQDDSMSFDNMAKVTSTTLISTTKSSKPSVPAKCSSSLNDGGSLCISSRSRSTSDRSSHLPQVGDTSCSSALLRPDWDQTQLNCLNPWPQMWIVSIWFF